MRTDAINWFASSELCRSLQDGGKTPLTEKLRIVEESFSAPRLASATARRHGISNQLLFAWRKAYRDGRLGDIPGFVPAMIVPEQPEKGTGTGCRRIEIVIANGRRVIVDCDVEVETLLRIMRGLETLP